MEEGKKLSMLVPLMALFFFFALSTRTPHFHFTLGPILKSYQVCGGRYMFSKF